MNVSKNWYLIAIIVILVVAITGGYIYFDGEENTDSEDFHSYTEYHFELEMESDNQTTVLWPLPYDAKDKWDESHGNLSEIVYELKVTEGDGSINVNSTKHGRALKVSFNGTIRIEGNKRLYEDEFEDEKEYENKSLKYLFDDLTMRNKTKQSKELYFVCSSSDDTKIVYFDCYSKHVGKYDSSGTIGLYIEELTLKKGWQTMELSGNAPNYESP